MKLALLQRLCVVRRYKIERAERECRMVQEEILGLEHNLALAVQQRASAAAEKDAHRRAWHTARVQMKPFDSGDIICYEALMTRCDSQINQADQLISVRRMQVEEGKERLARAQRQLVERRMELNKAEAALERVTAALREHDEAVEEDELDEIAVMGTRLAW
jgi:flagellar biosynthesis chaperone FliJ